MKTTNSCGSVLTHLLIGAVVMLLVTAATASETRKPSKAGNFKVAKSVASSTAAAPAEKIELTGSRIPRKARKAAYTRDVDMTVAIIDRKQIDTLGGGSLTETLQKSPMIR